MCGDVMEPIDGDYDRSVFLKQKTEYEIKECDWSSDVCSSDLISSPAPTNRISAADTCATTSTLRSRLLALTPREPSFSSEFMSVCTACQAGASPNNTPVSTESTSVPAIARQSSAASCTRGRVAGASDSNPRNAAYASSNPTSPAVTDSSVLSVIICAKIRLRLAPSELRMAI